MRTPFVGLFQGPWEERGFLLGGSQLEDRNGRRQKVHSEEREPTCLLQPEREVSLHTNGVLGFARRLRGAKGDRHGCSLKATCEEKTLPTKKQHLIGKSKLPSLGIGYGGS